MTDDRPTDAELDALHDALSRLRGRRGPGGPGAHGGPGPFGGPPGFRPPHHGHRPSGPWGFGGPGPGPGGRGALARVRLLEAIAASEVPLTVSELGERIGVDQPRASKLVQQAVDAGLARREADPDDARRTRIVLTDEGRRLARGVRGERHDHLATALESFTSDERAELIRLLTKLAQGWPGR